MPYASLDVSTCRQCPSWCEEVLAVQTEWNEKELLKQVPGSHWVTATKTWHVPLSWATVVTMRSLFGPAFTMSQGLVDRLWMERRSRVDPALDLRTLIEPSEKILGPWDLMSPRLYPFQRVGVGFMLTARSGILADEMGTGKTVQTLETLRLIGETQPIPALPALIVCPNSVKYHWAARVPEWLPGATPYVIEKGTANARKVIKAARDDPRAVVICNIESVRFFSRLAPYGSVALKKCRECDPNYGNDIRTSICEVHPKEFNDFLFRTCVLDEAHRVKEPRSKQTRAIWQVFHQDSVHYRWALTGTPIANHPGDLWSIGHAVAPQDFPQKTKFYDRYCLMSWSTFGGQDVVGVRPDTRDELFRFLDPRFRRMTKALVLPQLPAKIRETRRVEMTPSQRKQYRELEKSMATRLDDGELLVVPNQLVTQTRLQQFAAGNVEVEKPDPDDVASWKVSITEPSPKLDALDEVLDELGDAPCVVAAQHRDLVELAAVRLGRRGVRHALITGDVSPYDRQRALEMLKTGYVRVLLFTIKAGGEGLDMSHADTLVNLQRSWSLVENVQTENRVHRIGSERHSFVRIIDIVTSDTIEQKQIERVNEKMKRLEEITRDKAALLAAGRDVTELEAEESRLLSSGIDAREE